MCGRFCENHYGNLYNFYTNFLNKLMGKFSLLIYGTYLYRICMKMLSGSEFWQFWGTKERYLKLKGRKIKVVVQS